MTRMKILTEAELRRIVPLDLEAIACVEDAFHALATKAVAMPPILRLDIPEHRGEVDVKTAYVPGLSGFAIKISPGFFDNPKIGLPSTNGLMVLFSATTGLVEAVSAALSAAGIGHGIHYPAPVHLLPATTHLGFRAGTAPRAEEHADQILSLPMFPGITADQQEHVVRTLHDAVTRRVPR